MTLKNIDYWIITILVLGSLVYVNHLELKVQELQYENEMLNCYIDSQNDLKNGIVTICLDKNNDITNRMIINNVTVTLDNESGSYDYNIGEKW